jgi:hypothetical protein
MPRQYTHHSAVSANRLHGCDQLRLTRFKLAGPPTPRDIETSNAYAVIHDSLGPVCICILIGINSNLMGSVSLLLRAVFLLLVFHRIIPPFPIHRLEGLDQELLKRLPCHHSNIGAATTSMRVGCEPASNWTRPFSFLARTSNAMISSLLGHARYTVLRSCEATSQYG